MNPIPQHLRDSFPTNGALLGRAAGVHEYDQLTSTLSLVNQHIQERPPPGVRHMPVQSFPRSLAEGGVLLSQHRCHRKVLRADYFVPPHIVPRELMQEVSPLVGHLFVQFSEGDSRLRAPIGNLLLPREFLLEFLDFREGLVELLRTLS